MYITSMFFIMVKSRLIKVETDIGSQFEPPHMSLLANRIAEMVDLSVPFSKDFYVNKERMVVIDGSVELKVNLNE